MIQAITAVTPALQQVEHNPDWVYFIVVLFGVTMIIWAIIELAKIVLELIKQKQSYLQ